MRSFLPLTLVAGVLLSALVLTLPMGGSSAADGEDWRQQLVDQLAEEEGCVVSFFSQVSVVRQDGREIIAARAHCDDRRAFDVTRISPATAFDLQACDTSEERTC
ncbi:hypothetical protein [Algihabitans albus]|uniref:hypothetical protein n=1 Tax=Algihabitans albus TaxID=2164067 RepID=UPI000E5C8B36|nr:hypothetical protein [Algihabitans albus]